MSETPEQTGWRLEVPLTKRDEDKRQVFGWLSISQDEQGRLVIDHDKDVILPDELERFAYEFVLESRAGSDMHLRTEDSDGQPIATLIESMVFTLEKQTALGIPAGVLPVGWWVGFQVHDEDTWQRIKSGELAMFSIEGTGIRTPIDAL